MVQAVVGGREDVNDNIRLRHPSPSTTEAMTKIVLDNGRIAIRNVSISVGSCHTFFLIC